MSENNRIYICSRGILKSCDYYSSTPTSSIKKLINYPPLLNLKKENNIPIIYVCSSAIPEFIKKILNQIDFEFKLVSGDCDEDIPNDILNKDDFDKFINNKYLKHWFCQNWIGEYHPKVSIIPIGLDYHTMTQGETSWGPMFTPEKQEQLLIFLKDETQPFWERELKCYSNFHFFMTTRHGYDRINAFNSVPKELVFYENEKVERFNSWYNQSKYAFVLSPHGNGLDCHRTWEALILGCIPIVKESKIDELYKDLPVLIVKDWRDVTQDLLLKTIEEFKYKKFYYEKLTLEYWINLIKNT